ncbi:MAG TPA: DUF4012 domain-containing protein [Actinomycetota bacterium]
MVLGVAVILLLGLGLVAAVLFVSRDNLAEGRTALMDARRAIAASELPRAEASLGEAEAAFDAARGAAAGPVGTLAGWVPFAGNNVDVAAALADAGTSMTAAGKVLVNALEEMPEGLGSLAPSEGRIPLDSYGEVGDAVAQARVHAEQALTAIRTAPTSYLAGPVLDARWTAEDMATDVVDALRAGELVVDGIPRFAGSEGPRHYLVVAENPAELRGTGGLWGAYAILTFDEGTTSFGATAPTQSLPAVDVDAIDDVSADYRENYDQFGGAASWQNLNMTPDFPSAAKAALGNLEAGGGPSLDGVIAADPFALAAMLRVTGPVPVPGLDLRVGTDNVVPFTTFDAYELFDGADQRKEVLGGVAAEVFTRFLEIQGRGPQRLRALASATSGGHLKLYVTDVELEQGLKLAGVAGVYGASDDGADVVAVTVNNAAANKVDAFAERSVTYDVRLGGPGESIATLTTDFENHAPTEGPKYALGPHLPQLGPGDQLQFVTASCGDECELLDAERDGDPVGTTTGSELGLRWFRDYRTIPVGSSGSFSVTWRTSDAWEGNSSGGTYRITFLGQTTIEPTDLTVSITVPDGTRVIWSNEPMEIDGSTATWHGETGPRTTLEVRFSAPLPLRYWRNTMRLFG